MRHFYISKHKSTDYKLTAVKYYLKGKSSLDEVCNIFNCSPKSLYRWVKRYKMIKTLQRQNRKPISYKIPSIKGTSSESLN